MIVGTAGHVDHGKTALVRALTGVDTDRLAEEKARGISIELGFAYTTLDGDDESSEPVGFIDVPGHRKFVQTMIAGAAGIDVGLLVVAADDGPMPQTREHLAILSWLGVDALIVALSKVDAVDAERRGTALAEVRDVLATSPYAAAPVVPVSAVSGEGLAALRETLREKRERGHPRPSAARFRLAIDRVFALQGIGLVVTGTCVAGQVALDDHLTLLPSRLAARVRSIHAQDRAVASAHAGQRVALNLVGRGIEKGAVSRGDWIVADELAITTDRVDAVLAASDPAQWNAKAWRSLRFHAGAASVNARVTRLAADDASPPIVQIVFESPQHVVAGDRFVLRDASIQEDGAASLAGGVVLDVDVPTRGRRSAERLAFLATAAKGDARATLAHAVAASPRGVDLARWNVVHNGDLAADAIDARIAGAATLFSHARWDALLSHVLARLADEHARAPDAVGPGRDRLRRMAAPALDAARFASVVDALRADGRVAQTGAWLHLPSHRVELSSEDRSRFARARGVLEKATERFNPPRVRDLAVAIGDDEAALRSVFVRLAARGEVYKVAHDHFFLPATVRELARIAAELHANDGMACAAPFRDRLGIGRKVAIQILEFFDRIGYTRRVGDDHRVIQPGLFDA
jgi:selenocysteine-specific elongation factor